MKNKIKAFIITFLIFVLSFLLPRFLMKVFPLLPLLILLFLLILLLAAVSISVYKEILNILEKK